MAKHILFVLHGMGKHPANWEKEIKDTFNAAMKEFPTFRKGASSNSYDKLTDKVRVVPISYDHFFETQRKKWIDDANSVLKVMKASPGSVMEAQMSEVEATNLLHIQSGLEKDDFFNTHVLDVLLYRFTNIGERIRVRVAKSIVDVLAPTDSGTHSFSIMAHSLGTSVIHDTLHALYSHKKWREDRVNKTFSPSGYQASHLILLANVSRVLQSSSKGAKAYESKVKPGSGGVCNRMLNIAHDFDPFAQVKPFSPGDKWLAGRKDKYEHVLLNSVTQTNVHSLTHYLENPSVHVPILRAFTSRKSITEAQEAAAYRKYQKTTINHGHKELTKKLQALKLSEPRSWQEVLTAWNDYAGLVEQFQPKIG